MTGMDLYINALGMIAAIEAPEGADPDALAPRLEAWFDASEDKIGAYTAVLARFDAEEAALKAERDAFTNALARIATQRAHVRDLVRLLLETREQLGDEPKIKRPGFSAYLMTTDHVVVADDPDSYPERFHVVTVRPDKTVIKAAIKAGEEVPGCALVAERSLVVRK